MADRLPELVSGAPESYERGRKGGEEGVVEDGRKGSGAMQTPGRRLEL